VSAPRFLPRRELGKTGFTATRVGVGDLADRNVPFERCVETLRRALDFGLNLVDTAPSYEEGLSERVVGAAIEGRRSSVFVIDKVDHFDRPVLPQIGESLERLGIESADLFVLHGVSSTEQWRALTATGGAWHELAACRKAGKCRFVGISAHHPEVLEEVLDTQSADVLMFPVGPYVDARYVERILPRARERGVGSVCFKTFGAGKLLGDTEGYGRPLSMRPRGKLSSGGHDDAVTSLPRLGVAECVRYTLTLDPDVALLGMSYPNEQDAALDAAEAFEPLSLPELEALRKRAEEAMRKKGACWWNPPPPDDAA
jgi:aryl-alcohol dehydrogenase-like predicted oxidoreductase